MDTVFYSGKIKRGKTVADVYGKMVKGVGKKGITGNWELTLDGNTMCLDFHDDNSDAFCLECNEKGEFDGFFKTAFEPLTTGEFEAFFDLLYKAKALFGKIEIKDDYGIAENYWNSKKYKITMREPGEKEYLRWKSIYDNGTVKHEDMLRFLMAEDMGMSPEAFADYKNYDLNDWTEGDFPPVYNMLEKYLYETAAFEGKRLCEMPDMEYFDLGKVSFSVFAFLQGVSLVFTDGTGESDRLETVKKRAFSEKDAQTVMLFNDFFLPAYEKCEGEFEKTLLVYGYFLSVYDYAGFTFAGKSDKFRYVTDEVLEEYGKEKGTLLLNFYCTHRRYINTRTDEKAQGYLAKWKQHMLEKLGENGEKEYNDFVMKYKNRHMFRFEAETKYMARKKIMFIDDRLVL